MIGISLTPEQIRRAPPEVRRWLQGEIASSLELEVEPEPGQPGAEVANLAACSLPAVAAIFEKIRGVLPAVNVFFELGRGGEFTTSDGLVGHRVVDMTRHARLTSFEQLDAALQLINHAVRELFGRPEISLYAIDQRGYCLVPLATQRSIAMLWEQLVSGSDVATTPADSETFPPIHATLPPDSMHMTQATG